MELSLSAILDAVSAAAEASPSLPSFRAALPSIRAALSAYGEVITLRRVVQVLRDCGFSDDVVATLLRRLLGAIAVSIRFVSKRRCETMMLWFYDCGLLLFI